MSDNLTTRLNAFESQVASEHTALMAAIAAMQDALNLVASNTDLALENGAANTKAIIAALGQTGGCFPCPTPSITVPTVPTTPVTIDTDLCKRAEWFIATIHSILTSMDTLQSFNVIGSFNVINDAIGQVIAAIAAGDTIPLPSFPEGVNIVGDYISYAGERVFSGVGLVEQFSPLEDALRDAIYSAGSAGAAQSAYNALINGSSVSNAGKLLFIAIAYNALWAYAFDPGSTPDLSDFAGTECGFPSGTCFTLDGVAQIFDNGTHINGVTVSFGPFTPVTSINTSSGTVNSDLPAFFSGDLTGWTVEALVGNTFIYFRTGGLSSSGTFDTGYSVGVDGIAHAAPSPTGSFFFNFETGGSIRICKV